MNSILKRKKTSVGKTPPWLKRLLLVLLLASTVAGFSLGTLMVRRSAGDIPSLFNKIPSLFNKPAAFPRIGESEDFMVFLDKTGLTKIEIICHGMGVGKDGISRAVVDGKIVAPGAVIRGMKILDINVSNILVECNGKSLRLEPGERVTPEKNDESQQSGQKVKPSALF
jgi:hypothetical protein